MHLKRSLYRLKLQLELSCHLDRTSQEVQELARVGVAACQLDAQVNQLPSGVTLCSTEVC